MFKLKPLLVLDALTCLVTGLVLVSAAGALAGFSGLPQSLLFYAGVILFPCAALMLLAWRTLAKSLVWLVIIGNVGWAVASVVVAFAFEPTSLGSPNQFTHVSPALGLQLDPGGLLAPKRGAGSSAGGLGIAPGGGAELGRVEVIHR